MVIKIIKIMVVLLMLAGLSGSGYLWHQKDILEDTVASLEKDVESEKKRQRMLQKKYTQEKAKLATCMRAKLAEENKKARLIQEVKAIRVEKEALAAKIGTIEKELQEKITKYEARVEKLMASRKKLKESREKIMDKYKQTVAVVREKTEEIYTLTGEKKDLESQLNMTEKTLERSNKHNARLCEVAEELTEKYREKAGNGDPFTKLKMVEIEHLIQSYLKRIDKEKIVTQ